MTISFHNKFTGEFLQKDFENTVTRETLNRHIARVYIMYYPDDWNIYACPPRLFKQEIVIGEIVHLLSVFLKYSPLIITPVGEKNSYCLFLNKRKMRIFSLRDGVFVEMDTLDLQKPYEVMSANDFTSGLSKEASAIFEAARPKWEGKLRLAYTNSNTIREDLTPSEPLLATDEEMRTEAVLRLQLLGFSSSNWEFFLLRARPSASEQEYMYIKRAAEQNDDTNEPVFLKEESYYYQIGAEKGWAVAHDDKKNRHHYAIV